MTTRKDEIINQLLDEIERLTAQHEMALDAYEQHGGDFYNHEEEGL